MHVRCQGLVWGKVIVGRMLYVIFSGTANLKGRVGRDMDC